MTASRLAFTLLTISLPLLAGCAFGPESHATQAREAACRARADQVYLMRNPGSVYQADQYASGVRDSPYSAAGAPGNTSAGLSDAYDRQTILDDCLDATGGQPSQPSAAPAAPAPPSPGSAPRDQVPPPP